MIFPHRALMFCTLAPVFIFCATLPGFSQVAKTHMNVAASQHVSLEGFDPDGPNGPEEFVFGRIFPDGTSGPFEIPAGKVLVITGMDWLYIKGISGVTQTINIHIKNRENASHRGSGLMSSVTLGRAGNGGTSVSMTSGFVLSPGGRIDAEAVIPMDGHIARVLLRGYLILDE